MKFPSLRNLFDSIRYAGKRFPFEMLFAIIGTLAAIVNTELKDFEYTAEEWCIRTMMTANLGLVISLAATLLLENKGLNKARFLGFKLLAALGAASLIFLINPLEEGSDVLRFFLLSLAGHLLVAFAPFTKPGYIHGFWQFNKTLFLRFLTSVLYSAVLYAGIAAALGSINFLFNAKFEYDSFLIIWFCIAGLFNTTFFLAGIPKDPLALEEDLSYPKALKIFTQYVLIPLATVYIFILLSYEIKILAEWNLPKGMVSYLILGYAVYGILSLLLIFPIRNAAENKWVNTFAKSFYFLMLPLIVLLLFAVGTRIADYGITESRYLLILLAGWLLFITVYFLVSTAQNIKLIPISLFIITLFSIYGPQSAFSVAAFSQKTILVRIFKKHHAEENGKLKPLRKITDKDGKKALSVVEYLVKHHDFSTFQPIFRENLKAIEDSINTANHYDGGRRTRRYDQQDEKMKWVATHLGIEKFMSGEYREVTKINQINYLKTIQPEVIKVTGYDFVISDAPTPDHTSYHIEGTRIIKSIAGEVHTIQIGQEKVTFNIKELLSPIVKDEARLKTYQTNKEEDSYPEYRLPQSMLSFTKTTNHYSITYIINSAGVAFSKKDSSGITYISYLEGTYLIKKIK